MYLIAGLGNPGTKYEGTRHNIGWQVIDELAEKYELTDMVCLGSESEAETEAAK